MPGLAKTSRLDSRESRTSPDALIKKWHSPGVPAKLRKLDRHVLTRGDEQLIVLRDPLAVSEPIALPAHAAAILDQLDGSRTPAQIRQSLLMRGTLDVSTTDIAELVEDLGRMGMLDDDTFRQHFASILQAFLGSPDLEPRNAGLLYPDDPDRLAARLDDVFGGPGFDHFGTPPVHAVVCPHQPPTQVAQTLRSTLDQLPRADQLDAIVILATDHAPGLLPYVTTGKQLVSPLGRSPVSPLVAAACEDLPWLTREEIRFRQAMSLEFQTVLIHRIFGSQCPPIVPVLCGQTVFDRAQQPRVDEFLATFERLTAGRRVLYWAAAECSHVGPAFGRSLPEADVVEAHDRHLLSHLTQARTQKLRDMFRRPDPVCGRPSGGAVLATLADLLDVGTRGEICSYTLLQAPGADGRIGIAGVKLHRATAFAR